MSDVTSPLLVRMEGKVCYVMMCYDDVNNIRYLKVQYVNLLSFKIIFMLTAALLYHVVSS